MAGEEAVATEKQAGEETKEEARTALASESRDSEEKVTEEKASEEKAGEEAGEEEKKSEGAPEKYEFAAPEGMELDEEALGAFEPVAREMNLTQEQAQQFVNLYGEQIARVQEAQLAQWNKTVDGWLDEAKKDEEIGGKAFSETLDTARKALSEFGTPELLKALDDSGMGNHPEVIRFAAKVGKAVSDDRIHSGGGRKSGQKSAAELLYPTMTK